MGSRSVKKAESISVRKINLIHVALDQGYVSEDKPLAGFVDIDGMKNTVAALTDSFPDHFEHAFAVKANSMIAVLSRLREFGMGAEVASEGEIAQALRAGFNPGSMVFDEPAKSSFVIASAIEKGINLNIDNFQEFEVVAASVAKSGANSRIGFRINPQIGEGNIAAMSTATSSSKFGIPLRDDGVRERLIGQYADHSWLTSIHTHVGSQGCPMELLAEGIGAVVDLAEEINNRIGSQQIATIDIGGGLTVNFGSEEITPSFADYAQFLRSRVPLLFEGKYRVLTEFGRSIMAKNGFILARVEYAKCSGGQHIAITHGGVQIAVRTVFAAEAWPLRITAHHSDGRPKKGDDISQDIVGPCCFAGDKLASNYLLPLLERGDIVAVHDTGAYYFSNPFYYNSHPAAPVYGFASPGDEFEISTLRPGQSQDEMMAVIG